MIARLLFVVSVLLTTVACGGGGEESYVKDYRFYVNTNDLRVKAKITEMLNRMNTLTGATVLTVVSSREEANSFINLRPFDPALNEDKVGYGLPNYETEVHGDTFSEITGNVDTTLHFNMKIDLDINFVKSHILSDNIDDLKTVELLVNHEFGHGIFMKHDMTDQTQVMYWKLTVGKKNLPAFYNGVRNFFGVSL